jgi:predicted RNA-binding protein
MLVHQVTKARKALTSVSHYEGIDFAYAVFKNKQLIDNKLSEVDFIKNVSPQIVEYEEKRVQLCEEFAKKDSNGKSIIENDLYVIDNKEMFKIKMDDLLNEYKPFVEERQKQIEIFNNKMNEESKIEFVKIKKEQIPPQLKTADELDGISFMID